MFNINNIYKDITANGDISSMVISITIFILVIGYILPIGLTGVNEAELESVDIYTCCNTFVTSNGTLLNGMDVYGDWYITSTSGLGAYYVNETSDYIEGTQALKLSTDNTTKPLALQWNLPAPMYITGPFELWVKVENKDNTSDLGIYFSNTTAFSSYMAFEWEQISYRMDNGWTKVQFSTYDFNYYNGMTSTHPINAIRFRNIPISGKRSNITIDNFRMGVQARPKVIINFDDGHGSVYDNAKTILSDRGLVAALNVVTDKIDADPIYSTTAELRELEGLGWDITSHTKTHADLNTLSTSELHTELGGSKQWLLNNGFNGKAAQIVVYPYGNYNSNVLNIVDNYYLLGRSTDFGDLGAQIQTPQDNVNQMLYTIPWINMNNDTTVAFAQDYINSTIARNGTMWLTFHRLTTGTPTISTEYNTDNFTAIMDYIDSRSADIDAIVPSQYIIHEHIPGTDNRTTLGLFSLIIPIALAGIILFLVMNFKR